jgi:hypothetical protein
MQPELSVFNKAFYIKENKFGEYLDLTMRGIR